MALVRLSLIVGVLGWVSIVPSAQAQYRYDLLEQPEQTLGLPRLQYLKLDVEAEKSSQTSHLGAKSEYERLYLAPAIGIRYDNNIYHPDLLNFSILAEPGYSWQQSGQPDALTERDDF